MKLSDMTFKQITEICANRKCNSCPFHYDNVGSCKLLRSIPSYQDLDMEVNTDAED